MSTQGYGAITADNNEVSVLQDDSFPDEDLASDGDVDEDETYDSSDPSEDTDGNANATGPKNKTAHRAGIERAKARRVASKALELDAVDEDTKSLLAMLLGVEDSTIALTVAVYTGSRTNLSYLDVLEQAMDEDAIGIGVLVSSLGREMLRQVWTLARLLGADLPEKVPAQGRSTTTTLARTLADMPDGVGEKIATLRELTKRG